MYNRNRNILETIKKKTGMKYTEIARYIGVSPGAVRNWKEGRTRPSEKNDALLKELYHNALIKRDINDKKQQPNEYTKMITTISKAFDMSREDIAEYVGVSENAVTTWSVGPTIPKEHNEHKLKELHEKALSALDHEEKEAEIKEEDQAAEEPERSEKGKLNNSLLKDGISGFENLTTNKVVVQLKLTKQEYLTLRNESRSSPLPFEQYAKKKLLVEKSFLRRIFDAMKGGK